MSNQSPNPSSQSIAKWFIFLVVTLIIGGALIGLPVAIQRIAFGLIILIGLVIIPESRIELLSIKNSIQPTYQAYKMPIAHVSFVITLILIGLAAHFYQPQFYDRDYGFYCILLSLPFLRLSYPNLPTLTTSILSATQSSPPSKIRWFWIVVSVICMIIFTLMNAPKSWALPNYPIFFGVGKAHEQMLVLCIGLLTLLYGFGVRFIPRRFQWERHHTVLIVILLIAGFMRLWNLEEAARFFMDEFLFIKGINTISSNSVQLLYPSSNAFTDIFSYLQYALKTLTEPNLTALRIPSALFGLWAVLGVYMLAKEFFHVRIALLSAFLLALMPAHIHFSRIGINNIAGASIGIWSFAYMMRGMRRQQLSDFALAGVCLGLTHYFYEGERLFLTAFFLCWLAWITVFCRRKSLFRLPYLKELVVVVFCLLAVTTPLYHTLWSQGHSFARRLDITHNPDMPMLEQTVILIGNNPFDTALQRYTQTPSIDGFYQSEFAYVISLLVPFFLLGCVILIWRIFTVYGALFIWWALGVSVANSFILDTYSAASPRYVVVYAMLMMITAVGIHTLWSALSERVTSRLRLWVQLGFWIYLGCFTVYQMDYYFNTVVQNFHDRVFAIRTVIGRTQPAHDDMMLRAMNTLPDNTTLHVFTSALFPGDLITNVPIYYGRADEITVVHRIAENLTEDYFADLPHDSNHVFTFTAYHAPKVVEMISKYFVITKIEGSRFNIPGDVEMKFYFAPLEPNAAIPSMSNS